jgi:hypothetical protein
LRGRRAGCRRPVVSESCARRQAKGQEMKPGRDRTRAAASAWLSARRRSPMTGGCSPRRLRLKENNARMSQ